MYFSPLNEYSNLLILTYINPVKTTYLFQGFIFLAQIRNENCCPLESCIGSGNPTLPDLDPTRLSHLMRA